MYKCQKIKIIPTAKQRTILLHWMNMYNKMYNETLKFFKKVRNEKLKIPIDGKQLRTYYLKDKR